MAILSKGTTYSTGAQVTAANLNALVDSATFDDPADETTIEKNTSSGKLQVKAAGIGASQLGTGAVTTVKLGDTSVTTAKLGAAAVTGAKIATEAIDSDHYVDASIDSEHLNADVITGQTELTAAPADTDEFLISDNGTLKRIDVSDLFKHPALPQAYGIVDFENGVTTVTSGYNVSSAADPGTDYREITLSITMASATDYVVLVTEEGTSQVSSSAVVAIDSATQFTIHRERAAGAVFTSQYSEPGHNMGLLDGLFGGDTPDAPKRTDAGKEMYRYLFGKDEDRTLRDVQGVTDSRIWDQLLGVEAQYRPEWQRLNQEEQERALFGPLGMLDQQRRATEYAGQTAADAAQYQRERDMADVGAMAGDAVRINRESDPQRAAQMAQQQSLTDEIFGRAFGLTPQQERQATQAAREGFAARGRLDDNASLAAELLSREEVLRQNRQEALQAGNSMFNQYQATSIDPWEKILGRGTTAPGMAAQQQMSAQGLLGSAVPGLFDPDQGVNLDLQHRANQAGYSSAMAGANAAQSGAMAGGLMSGLGSIFGGLF